LVGGKWGNYQVILEILAKMATRRRNSLAIWYPPPLYCLTLIDQNEIWPIFLLPALIWVNEAEKQYFVLTRQVFIGWLFQHPEIVDPAT